MKSHSDVFNNIDTLLALSISHGALDSSKTKMELVKDHHLNGQEFVCASSIFSLFLFSSLLL